MMTIEHVVILTQLNGTCGNTYTAKWNMWYYLQMYVRDINVDIE